MDCDPALVRLALQSLLSNALKFTRPRDRAVITIRPVEHEGQAGIAVQDNGVGFKMAYAGKLFGVFQRLHRPDEFEGNGAGLALVQRIAQKHGGRVWAESGVDGRRHVLPHARRAARLMLPDELDLLLVEARPARGRARCSVRCGELAPAGRIGVARDGEEALDYLLGRGAFRHRLGGSPARLVLLELRLPRLDGIEVLRALRASPRTARCRSSCSPRRRAREVAQCYQAGRQQLHP